MKREGIDFKSKAWSTARHKTITVGDSEQDALSDRSRHGPDEFADPSMSTLEYDRASPDPLDLVGMWIKEVQGTNQYFGRNTV